MRCSICCSPSAGGGGGGGSAARSGPVYRGGPTYNTYVAPPVYGGYGYGGGFSLFPTFVSPVFGFGGERLQGLGLRARAMSGSAHPGNYGQDHGGALHPIPSRVHVFGFGGGAAPADLTN